MTTVLLTGASGFVGLHTCRKLLNDGYSVVALVRNEGKAQALLAKLNHHENLTTLIGGDLSTATPWNALFAQLPTAINAIVHLAARVHVMNDSAADPLQAYRDMNVGLTENLAKAAIAHGVERFVFMSSIKVNGESTNKGQAFCENSKPMPVDPYGVSKLEAEQKLKALCETSSMHYVIIRPPLIYGPGVGANFLKLINLVATGAPLPFRLVHNRRSMIFVGNLVDIIEKSISSKEASNNTFLVSDGEPVSTWQLIAKIARAQSRSARALPIPASILKLMLCVLGKGDLAIRLLGSLEIDSEKLQKQLGWQAPFSAQEGINNTVAWYQQHDQS